MGCKSSMEIERTEAVLLIMNRIFEAENQELSEILESLGFGEKSNLPYYGYNFKVVDNLESFEDNDSIF